MKYGLIGEKLSHSFSKDIHEQLSDCTYILKELNANELCTFFKDKNFQGINVTIPYKERVFEYLDDISDEAKKIGAVNTVVNSDGRLIGFNTDYFGLVSLINRIGISVKNAKVLILGTGGTSKTAKAVCEDLGAETILKVSRTKKDGAITYEEMYSFHTDADILINTTPCAMFPNCTDLSADIERFTNLSGVIDVIYNPISTPLVVKAKEKGIRASGGLYMLVAQAVYASEKFTGRKYSDDIIEKIYSKVKSQKQNIVLIGMPSSGKSSIAKKIKELSGKDYIDTDDLISSSHNMEIKDIFKSYGEKTFRQWEKESIIEVSQKNSIVIATGGGAVLDAQNISALKQNGKVYFINRPLSSLCPTSSRPLSSDFEMMKTRFEERYPIYVASADHIVDNTQSIEDVAKLILTIHNSEVD